MTKLASEVDRLSDFKHVCYVLYECSNNKWSVTPKDLELILGFLCDLQNDAALELGTFGLPQNGLVFFLVASTSLLIEHLSDVSQFDLFQPTTCLVRLLLECIGKSGDLLCQASTALRCLLDWESLPEVHLDQVVQALEKEKERICIFKDIQPDRIGLMKSVNMFFRLREPALASELWNEVTQFPDRLLSSEEPGQSSIEASTAEAQFTAHMASVQAFWRYQGPEVILNKLDDLPVITEFSDSVLVLGSIRMAKSLSGLLFSALSCTPSNERNRTSSKTVQVYADHRSSTLSILPESIAYRWTRSLTKQLRGGLMRLASSLLRLQKSSTQPPAEISDFVYELNTELAILCRSVEQVKTCDIAYEVREMISAWNCSTGIALLRFIDSMMSDAPSESSPSVPCDVQYQWTHRVPSWCLSPTQSYLDRSMENPDNLVRISTGISTCADLVKLVLSLILPDPLTSNRLRSYLLFDAPILGPACELRTDKSVNLATLDAPIEPEMLELEKQSRMDRFTLLCGQPLQSILLRLAVGLSRSLLQFVQVFAVHKCGKADDQSKSSFDRMVTTLVKLLERVLSCLNELLLMRANLMRCFVSTTGDKPDTLTSNPEVDSQIGSSLAQLNYTLDTVQTILDKKFSDSHQSITQFARLLNPELSRLVYLLASSNTSACVMALKELNYSLDKPEAASKPWPLWPGPRVFCLLSGHIIDTLRPVETTGLAEELLRNFWTGFLHSIRNCFPQTSIDLASSCRVDISSDLLQFACFLAGQFPGLTAKKALLTQLMTGVCDLCRAAERMYDQPQRVVQLDNCYRVALRLLVLLRYALHHFYVPPTYLAHQLKPSMALTTTEPPSSRIWQFTAVAIKVGQIVPKLRPWTPDLGAPFFYDLLLPASREAVESVKPVYNLPSPDGLAILSLASQLNYDELFAAPLSLLDMHLWMRTSPESLAFPSDLETVGEPMDQCRWIPFCWYGLALSWRLLEILPPSVEFVRNIHSLLTVVTTERSTDSSTPVLFHSPSYLLYLIVFLDRLQGKPTGLDARWLLDCTTEELGQGSKTTSSTRISSTNFAESTFAKKGLQAEKQLAREIYRSVCAQTPTTSPTADADTTAVPSGYAPYLSSTASIRALLSSMRPSPVGMSLIFEVASTQLRQAVRALATSAERKRTLFTYGQVAYWIGLSHFLGDLSSALLAASKSIGGTTEATALCSKSSLPPKGSTAVVGESNKRGAKSRTRHAAGKVQPEQTESESVSERTTNVTIEVLETLPLESKKESPISSPTEQVHVPLDTNRESGGVLTDEQVTTMQLRSVQTSKQLLSDCIHLLSSLVDLVRLELNFPVLSDMHAKDVQSTPCTQILTSLCPDRLICAVDAVNSDASFPAAWVFGSSSRHRLAMTLKLVTSAYRSPLAAVSTLSADVDQNLDLRRPDGANCYSQLLFTRLIAQLEAAMSDLSSAEDESTSATFTEQQVAIRLVSRLRVRQLCKLAKTVSGLASHLVGLLYAAKLRNLKSLPWSTSSDERQFRTDLASVARLFLDPVATAMGVNLLYCSLTGISVAQYLACEVISVNRFARPMSANEPESSSDRPRTAPVSMGRLKPKQREQADSLIVQYLDDHLLTTVIRFVTQMSNSKWNISTSCVFTQLCCESLHYLEVATGCPRVVKRCLIVSNNTSSGSVDDESSTFPLLRLFGVSKVDESKVAPLVSSCSPDCVEATQPCFVAMSYQSALMRLLCTLLLRALNASTKTRHLFVQLAQQACEICLFGSWHPNEDHCSLLSHWLTAIVHTGSVATADLLAGADNPWLVDILSSDSWSNSTLDTFMETEESTICQALSSTGTESMLSFLAASRDYCPKQIARWIERRARYRIALYFERLCRLLISDWHMDKTVRQTFCAHVLSEAIGVWRNPALLLAEQMSRPGEPSNVTADGVGQVTLPWLVSALRCLVLGCSTGISHVKLSGLFSAWSDTFVATLRSLQAPYAGETNTTDSCNFDAVAKQNSSTASVLTSSVEFWPVELRDNINLLSSALCGIYEYGALIVHALNPSYEAQSSTEQPLLPRLAYFPNFFEAQPDSLASSTEHDCSRDAIQSFSRLCTHFFTCHSGTGLVGGFDRKGLRAGSASRRTSTRKLSTDACDSGNLSKSEAGSKPDKLPGPNADSLSEFESDATDGCLNDRIYWRLGDPRRNDHVCTYTATQQAYCEQSWYHCHTCRLAQSSGVCSVCAQVCHAGHDLSYAKLGPFFCDCGALKESSRRCRALTCRVQTKAPYTFCGRPRENWISSFVDNELLNVYAPWFADGYSDLGRPSFVFQHLASLPGDSEDNLAVNTDHSDQADEPPDTTRSDGFQRLKTIKKWTSDDVRAILPVSSSEPSDETVTRRRPPLTIITPGAAVIVADSAHEASATPVSVTTIDPRVSRRVDSASTLRRSGAVRYKLCPVETSSVSGLSKQPKSGKSGSDSRKSALSDTLRSTVRCNVHRGRVPNLSQQLRIRRLRLIQFLRLLSRKAVSREKHFLTNVTSQRRRSGSSKLSRLVGLCTGAITSLSLVPNEAALVAHIRSQLDIEDSEKYRANLILLLSTSNLVPQAAHLLTGSGKDGSSELPCIIDQLVFESTDISTEQRRRLAIQRLLSDQRQTSPVVRLCHDITAPVPFAVDASSRDIWRRVICSGRVFMKPVQNASVFDFDSHALAFLSSKRHSAVKTAQDLASVGSVSKVNLDSADPQSAPDTSAVVGSPHTSITESLSNRVSLPLLTDESIAALDAPFLLQNLINLLSDSEADATGIPATLDLTYENLHPILASRTALSWMNFLSAHPPSTQASTTPSTSNSQPRPASSINVVMCMLRVFQSHRSTHAHFLAVTGPEQIASRPTSPDFPVVIDHGGLTGGRMINIYRVDQTMLQAARCQDMGMLELGKLRLVTALLQMRHGQANGISAEETPTSMTFKSEWLTDVYASLGAGKQSADVGPSALELLSSIGAGTSELLSPFQPFNVCVRDLPKVCTASVNFDISSIAVNPVSPAIFAVCGAWDCTVLGISSSGQVCGRISVSPKRADRSELLIKAVWLPDSMHLLALLTSGSVQIFDIFYNPKEPKYHFKPVDGTFCDATFIRLPYVAQDNESMPKEHSESVPQEWGVHLVVMAKKMGSILYQQLGPDCQLSSEPFFLAEWLEWSPEALTLGAAAIESDGEEKQAETTPIEPVVEVDDNQCKPKSKSTARPAPPLMRNAHTGVLGGGGVSLYYASSLGLLFHAYQSGHSVASAIYLPGVREQVTTGAHRLRITHSFLLSTGSRRQSGEKHSTSKTHRSGFFGLPSVGNLFTSLLFAARGAVDPTNLSGSRLSESHMVGTDPSSIVLPDVGPVLRWSEVMGGHPGLVSAVSSDQLIFKGSAVLTTQHKPLLLAIEPDQVWVQSVDPHLPPTTVYKTGTVVPAKSSTAVSSASAPSGSQLQRSKSASDGARSVSHPVVLDSLSVYWDGTPSLTGRTITFLLASDGRLYFHATRPRSVIYDLHSVPPEEFSSVNRSHNVVTYPGQYWWQPGLWPHANTGFGCGSNSSDTCLVAGLISPLSPETIAFNMEQGGLWDLATLDAGPGLHALQSKRDDANVFHGDSNRELMKRLVDSPLAGPLPVDFFEYATITEEVEFGGTDLLQLYNRDQLRRRLLTVDSPVTGAGSFTNSCTPVVTSGVTGSSGSQLSKQNIAFVVEIHNRYSSETVIIGIRICLPAATGEYATRWPKFVKIFDRTIPITTPDPGAPSRMVDIPLYRSESMFCTKMLQVFVGSSSDPEGLTSVDTISVYTAPLAEVNSIRHDAYIRQLSSTNVGQVFSYLDPSDCFIGQRRISAGGSSDAHCSMTLGRNRKSIPRFLTSAESALAYRLDRLFVAGFITVTTPTTTGGMFASTSIPLPSSPCVLSSLINLNTSPIAIFKQSALDSHVWDRPFAVRLVFCGHPLIDSTHLIASISELITAVLHLDLNAESQDSTTVLMPTNLILTAGSSNHLQRLQTSSALQVLRDQVCRLLGSFLSKISSQTDIGSPYTLALSRQFENLLSATLRVEYKPQLPSVEQYRACFSQPVTNVIQSIVKRLTDQIGRVSHDREPEVDLLVNYTEQFCSLIYHLAAVDPGRVVAAQEQYNLISLLMDAFTALEHHLPMRTNLNEPLNPVWIDRVGLTAPVCSSHTESGSIGYTVNVRKFILSVVYGLYTLLISRLMPSETEMIQDLLMSVNLDGREQQHLNSVLINLLTHENLAVACATRDGLSRLILHARPSQPIAWFNIDHCSTLDGPSRQSTKRGVEDKSDAPSTKTSVPVSIPDESSRSACQVTVTSSTHDGRVPVTPYTARRRPPRNSSQTNQRVYAVNLEDLPFVGPRRPSNRLFRESSTPSILPAILDSTTCWGSGQDAEHLLNAIRLSRQLINSDQIGSSFYSQAADEDEVAVGVEDLEAELRQLQDATSDPGEELENAGDPEDLEAHHIQAEEEVEDTDDQEGQEEEGDVEDREEDEESEMNEDGNDLSEEVVNSALSGQMATFLAQLIAEVEQHNSGQPSMLSELQWPISSDIFDQLQDRQRRQQAAPSSRADDAPVSSSAHQPPTESLSSDEIDETAQIPSVNEQVIIPSTRSGRATIPSNASDSHQPLPPLSNRYDVPTNRRTAWETEEPNSVDQIVDVESIESAIHLLGSGSQDDPITFQHLLEQVDDDALLNYALQLSLRDQGGTGVDGVQPNESRSSAAQSGVIENSTDALDTLQDDVQNFTSAVSTVSAPQASEVPLESTVPDEVETGLQSIQAKELSVLETLSDSNYSPQSHILSQSYSLESIPIISDLTSDAHCSDSSSLDTVPWSKRATRRRRCLRQSHSSLLFALCIARHLSNKWDQIVTQASLVDYINPSVGVQRLVPSLQLLVTLVRTLHANVFYLHSKLGALPAGFEPSREAKLRRWLSVVRGTLKDLIHAFISSLPSPAVAIYSRFAPKPSTLDIDPHANLLQSQISHMANCHRSVAFELTVMQLNLVYELFSSMPHSLYPAVDPFSSVSSMSLLGIFLSDNDEGPGDAKSVVATSTLQTNELVDQTVDFCLNLLEVLHLRIQTVTNPVEATQDVSPKSFMLPTTANNPHAAGLLQASLLGTGSTQGLLAPSVATCLLSWSPLIEAQFALDHIANPLQEIAWLGMQASLRLPRLLLLLHHCMGSDHRDRQRRTSAHRKSSLIPADRESRWCSVLYDYLEVLTDKDRLSLQLERFHAGGRCLLPGFFVQNYPRVHEIVGRFERLIRGLLIRIVGAKHYRQLHDIHRLAHLTHRVREICSSTGEFLPSFSCITTDTVKSPAVPIDAQQSPATPFSSLLQQLEPFVHQLRLPYVAQREILQIISSCLNIATDRTSYWQRFCLRCPDTLIFLIHASLVLDREIARIMLSLVQLAVTSHTTIVSSSVIGSNANDSQSANIAVECVPPGSSPPQTNGARLALSMAQHLLPMDSENTDSRSAQPAVSPLFLQFVRVFLCHCPDVGIRNTTAHIVREIYRSLPSSSQLRLLDLLPLVWPDLPTFAPHSAQFVQLTIELLVDHPEWTGRLNLLEHITRLMLRRLDAIKRHPRRILYATLMHLIQPQRELGSQLPGSSTVNATSASDAQTIPRRPPEPPVAPRLANDISLSRSWSGLASLRQTISGQAAITSVPSTVPNISVSTITTTNNGYADNVQQSSATTSCLDVESSSTPLTNLGFVFELEPCLMCHAKATDDPFYVILRWDSDSGGSRVPIQVAMMTLHSHYGKFVDRLKQAMGQQQQQLIQRHALSTATSTVTATTSSVTAAGVSGGVAAQLTTNTNHAMPTASTVTASSTSNSNMIGQSSCTIPIVPVKLDVRATSSVHVFDLDAVYLISQLTVKFNILYKRQRYVRTLNVYTSDLIDRSASRLVHEPWMWQKVATVRLAPGQEAVRVCFSHPAPTPIWLGASQANYATDERFNADQLFSINSHYQGLAIRASRLIFEYADFHSTDSEANRDCPRCHTTDLLGIICPACHTNVNECTRCRSIDLSEGDVYLCANCGSSRNGKIEFSICARPCYSTVEPLHDREDRECACNRIVALSKELAKNAQLLARPLEVEVAQCLSDLVTMDAATTASVTSATWSGSGQSTTVLTKSKFFGPNMAALKSSPTADAKFLLAAASSAVSSLGSVHSGITRLAACVSEARAISLDAAAITRRLWAARQAVLQFDSAQQQIANAAETRAVSGTSTTAVSGQRPNLVCWPDYEELDGLFSSSISGCYSCLINTVHQCGRVLLGVAEHTPVHTVLDTNSEQHWLFLDPAESDRMRVGIQSPPGFTVIRDLITSLMESGLSVCPQTIQADLRCLIIQLTRDCPALITYLGKLLVDRLTQTALAQGDQGYLLGPLVFNDMALLQASVESILPTQFASSTTSTNINEIPGRAQPMDQRATFWECRLRPLFKLLVELSRPGRFPIGRGTQLDRCQGPPLPVVQNILIPLVDLLENLVTQSNSIATPPATPLVSLRQSKLQSQYGHVDPPNSVTTTGGGSGENQPLSVSSTHTFVPLLTTAPYIDFSAWLDARPYASFPAWRDRIVTLQLLGRLRHRVSVLAATINTNAAADTPGTMDVARKQVLVARFAIRWRTIVSDLQWARRWGITLPPGVGALEFRATSLQTSIESIPSNSWILSVMFSPPDTTARCIHSCMDLLYALSAAPTTARRRCPPSSVAQKSRNQISLTALHGKRRRLVLRFLVESCLPRLDALAAYRGAAITPSALIGSADVRGLSNVFNAGDAFVIKLCKLTIGPDTSRLGSDASPKTGGSTEENKLEWIHPPIVSFLLWKADILNHLGTLVDRMLLQMRKLETMTVRHWDELLAASLSSVSGTGGLHGGTPGYTLALVADLLRILEPLKQLPRRHQYKLLQILLHACVRLRQLVLQRTECTLRAQGLFSSMLDQLIGVSVSQIREFLTTTLNVLAEYPISDHQSAVYLLKRMCTPICPLDADQTVFHVSLEVWRGHEDYLLTRSRVELLSSDTRGLGPRIRNVIDYICTSNNLTTDMGLEIVCEGQILMPQLRLSDVYSQVWCANRQNVNKPMRLVYRIPGLESDSMPYLEQLTTGEIPPEQYQHISVLALHPHGLGDLLRRLATVHDPYQGRDLFDVLLHILHYCLKTPECRQRLIDPEVRSIPILLNALLVCLQADAPQSRQASTSSDLHEDITGRLVQIIEPILKMADEVEQPCPLADGFAAVTLPRGDLNTVLQLLACMSEQPEVPLIGRDVARLLGLLAFGDQKKMDVIVQFVQTHLKDKLKPTADFSRTESALLDCCCSLLLYIPRQSRNGALLHQQIVNQSGFLQSCLEFLWDSVPPCILDLDEEVALNTSDPEIAGFLALSALPHVLQVLRACVDGTQAADCLSQPETYHTSQSDRPRILAAPLLRFFHLLETSKSAGRVGLLAEDMLSEWCCGHDKLTETLRSKSSHTPDTLQAHNNDTLAEVIQSLRKATALRTRRLARNMRERQLRSMNMRVDEKGQVAVATSDRLLKMTATVTEEAGLACAICHEGFRSAPNEAMGIYAFVRQCPLEESLCFGQENATHTPPVSIPKGYSTLSNFVVVHFSCHANSLKVSSENQWVVAQRHNRDVKCNNLLPILGPPVGTYSTASSEASKPKSKKDQPPAPETVYAGHLANFMDFIMRTLSVSPGYVMALHDVKLLLVRFACNRSFRSEGGGGGRESNLQLLPHLMQVGLHSLLMSSSVNQKMNELTEFLELSETHWSSTDHCWNSTGPLYRTVAAMHLWPHQTWSEHRVALLRRLILVASGRLKSFSKPSGVTQDVETNFIYFKPYLLFFALVNGVYDYLFKSVSIPVCTTSGAADSWCASLSQYISTSDEALIAAVTRLLAFYQDDLLPITSLGEFADVNGLLGEVDLNELTSLMSVSST